MIDCETIKVTIPLKQPFVVSKGSAESKTNFLLLLNNRYSGEAAASVHYGASIEQMAGDLTTGCEYLKKLKKLTKRTLNDLGKLKICSEAKSALSAAVLNYLSGERNKYPWEVMELGTPLGIKSSITVSVGDTDDVIEQAKSSPYPIVKLKLGGENDLEIAKRLSEIEDKQIRVDANGAWSCEQAEEIIYYLAGSGVFVVEQPTDISNVSDWPHLKGKNEEVELIADEGVGSVADYRTIAEFVDGVNIKMEKCGGIVEAIKIARQAHNDKRKVMLGCMVESSVGIAQSVYVSSLADYFDLDAPLLLEDDLASGITYDRDEIRVDREIIGGPSLRRDIVQKYINL